ncbi:MAG TPA: site-specific integrase [Terriglobia bacterium]|nr:site-specific integrase [Terriglobia bacterium]
MKFFPEKIKQRSVLFKGIAKDYTDHIKQVKRDWAHDEARVEVLLGLLKDVPIAELTPGRLETVLAELGKKNSWADATHNGYRALLSAIFRRAGKNGKASANPVRETAHRKENNHRVRYLSNEEQSLMKVLREKKWPEREKEILVALHSGMRRSEQYRTAQVPDGGLKWEHINFRAGVIRLPRSKSNKPREIPMNSVLRETLRSVPHRIDSPYVFDGTDPAKWFRKVLKEAEVTNLHWHDLRHTFASRLAMAGVPMRHIAELMGHAEIQTTMRYAHLQPGQLADAVERLASEPTGGQTDTATGTRVLAVSVRVG